MINEKDIRELLQDAFGLDVDRLSNDDCLFTGKILDSLNSVMLLAQLDSRFGVKISPLDLTLADIDTIKNIENTIKRLS